MNRIKFRLPLTKSAAITTQLIGFALIIAAILRLLSGFSLGACVLIVLGAWMAWEGREGATKRRRQKQLIKSAIPEEKRVINEMGILLYYV